MKAKAKFTPALIQRLGKLEQHLQTLQFEIRSDVLNMERSKKMLKVKLDALNAAYNAIRRQKMEIVDGLKISKSDRYELLQTAAIWAENN